MPTFDSSALNDNDEALAFLRAVLAPPEGHAKSHHHTGPSPFAAADARPPCTRSSSGVPLIVGVAVSIMMATR
ncbi:hypothetical protein [Microvirga yunnanensis]|uniref:hypothetical protein n=1 Tax=Microvirga yunnanensis TaxID=2953740 RepID=UPI0021C64584|nr:MULTISPECIES: hypothetical protein [unclassified Microvirga]